MEKIYEEGNNNTKKKSVINLSVVLSFVIAVCAMFSLIAFGFNQVSYAVPDTAPDSFTVYRKVTDGSTFPVAINSFSSDKEIESTRFEVPLYYTDQAFTDLVFCIEKNHFVDNKDIYNKLEEINDTGLLYLLSNSYVNGKNVANGDKFLEAYVSQVAIWLYLSEKEGAIGTANSFTTEQLNNVKNARYIKVVGSGDTTADGNLKEIGEVYNRYIVPLITAAKNATELNRVDVNLDSKDLVKSDDGESYQTSIISVIATGEMLSYDINISGIDGAYAVDENGQELTTSNVAPGTKFYVRIPADKISEKIQELNISVTGHFKTVTGYSYANTDPAQQKLAKVVGKNLDVDSGLKLEVIGAPDTGMNVAQTIYFIGLVVLLCGVGIIYANAKPIEIKE